MLSLKHPLNLRIHSSQGVTLPELMIVLAVVAIALLVAVPSWNYFYRKNQTQTNIHRLHRALNFARMQAISGKERVFVCPYTPQMVCGQDWSAGLIIETAKQPLRIVQAFKGAELEWNRRSNIIAFLPSGRLATQNGSFTYSAREDKQCCRRLVILSITGRVRVAH